MPTPVAIATRTFGTGQAPLVYGWIFAAHQLGAAGAAYAAGLVQTLSGSYSLTFVGAA